jgi:thiol-disulfide isomerase/thioredoxin
MGDRLPAGKLGHPALGVEPAPRLFYSRKAMHRRILPLFGLGAGLALAACRPSLEPFRLSDNMAFKDLVTGQPYDTTQVRGKLLLLNFWAAWSPASIKELPELAELAKTFREKGLVVYGVCLDDAPAAELLVFAERQGVRYPLVWPGDKLLDAIQPLETIPYTVLIDNDGQVVARFRSHFKPRDLREAIEKNL